MHVRASAHNNTHTHSSLDLQPSALLYPVLLETIHTLRMNRRVNTQTTHVRMHAYSRTT